jgi:ABC-type branched-subunit amino acid transport system ATPase component
VLENVMLGAHHRTPGGLLSASLLPVFARPWERAARERALGVLRFVGLAGRAHDPAGSLAFADQRRLEIARALAGEPTVVILDEPAAGMHPQDVHTLIELIRTIAQSGITVLLIEHHMEVVSDLADRVTVLNFGRVIAEGSPSEITRDAAVIEAYLGEQREERRPPVSIAEPTPPQREPMLDVRDLRVRYGAAPALYGVDLQVYEGEVVALIGANGAGKTTTLKAISGVDELLMSARGRVSFCGERIDRRPAHRIARLGIAHVQEGRRLFPESSVEENLLLGAHLRRDSQVRADLNAILERFPALADRRHQPAGLLSGGEQQMLAIGRALAARPRFLLLDEPSLGLAPIIVDEVFEIIGDLVEQNVTILIVEQLATRALAIADRAYIMETGTIVRSGNASDLARDREVKAAYLGG